MEERPRTIPGFSFTFMAPGFSKKIGPVKAI